VKREIERRRTAVSTSGDSFTVAMKCLASVFAFATTPGAWLLGTRLKHSVAVDCPTKGWTRVVGSKTDTATVSFCDSHEEVFTKTLRLC